MPSITGHQTEEKTYNDLSRIATARKNADVQLWKRRYEKMEKLIDKLEPIEEKILKIILEEKQPIMDEIEELRASMVADCVHPRQFLIHKGSHVECKFCNKHISVPNE